MTVLDTSAVVDFLLGVGAAAEVERLMVDEPEPAAPDLLVFETLAVLRRQTLRAELSDARATAAVGDLGDIPIDLFPSLPLRARIWTLKHNLTVADATFVALAERLREPLATKDAALAKAASEHADVDVVRLGEDLRASPPQ